MNTAADCAERLMDPFLKARHLGLMVALKAMGVQATCSPEGQWMVTLPAATRFPGWIAIAEMEPQVDEMVILRTKHGSVFQGWRNKKGGPWPYEDCEGRAYCFTDFSHWMFKP